MIRIITNERNNNLKKRLQELIPDSKEVKIVVAYCNYPGIKELYETLKKLYNEDGLSQEHIKILVGSYYTKDEFIKKFIKSIKNELEKQNNAKDTYDNIKFFIKLLKEKIIVIKNIYWKTNHSKFYLFKIKKPKTKEKSAQRLQRLAQDIVISGSSNLTRAGLMDNDEFNTPIENIMIKQTEKYFNKLWEKIAIPLSKNDIEKLENEGLKA
jgi:HKD family nuclease